LANRIVTQYAERGPRYRPVVSAPGWKAAAKRPNDPVTESQQFGQFTTSTFTESETGSVRSLGFMLRTYASLSTCSPDWITPSSMAAWSAAGPVKNCATSMTRVAGEVMASTLLMNAK
jgi:hypothetical protein